MQNNTNNQKKSSLAQLFRTNENIRSYKNQTFVTENFSSLETGKGSKNISVIEESTDTESPKGS